MNKAAANLEQLALSCAKISFSALLKGSSSTVENLGSEKVTVRFLPAETISNHSQIPIDSESPDPHSEHAEAPGLQTSDSEAGSVTPRIPIALHPTALHNGSSASSSPSPTSLSRNSGVGDRGPPPKAIESRCFPQRRRNSLPHSPPLPPSMNRSPSAPPGSFVVPAQQQRRSYQPLQPTGLGFDGSFPQNSPRELPTPAAEPNHGAHIGQGRANANPVSSPAMPQPRQHSVPEIETSTQGSEPQRLQSQHPIPDVLQHPQVPASIPSSSPTAQPEEPEARESGTADWPSPAPTPKPRQESHSHVPIQDAPSNQQLLQISNIDLPYPSRRQSVPLNPASTNPVMAVLNSQVERAAPQTSAASNVRRQETSVPVNAGYPLELDSTPDRPHSSPPSHCPAEVAHQLQQGYTPPNPFAIQMGPGSTASQGHVTKTSSGPWLESDRAITQESSGSPQSYQRSEAYTPPQPIPFLPPNVNPAPLEQSQPSPRTTPLILMAAQTTGLPAGISAVLGPPLEFRPENVEFDSHVSPNGASQNPALRQASQNYTPSSCPSQQPPNAMMADNYWDTWGVDRFNFDDLFGMDRIFGLEST